MVRKILNFNNATSEIGNPPMVVEVFNILIRYFSY